MLCPPTIPVLTLKLSPSPGVLGGHFSTSRLMGDTGLVLRGMWAENIVPGLLFSMKC